MSSKLTFKFLNVAANVLPYVTSRSFLVFSASEYLYSSLFAYVDILVCDLSMMLQEL